jgi:hypothetical protein
MKRNIAVMVVAATASLWSSSSGSAQAPNKSSVTNEQFDRWMTELSNWGR